MSSCVFWSAVDEHGDNPTGHPADFEFRVGYELGVHDYDQHNYAPNVEVTGVDCIEISVDGEPPRAPTEEENSAVSEWFETRLDSNPRELKSICRLALEYSQLDPPEDDD